MKYNNLPSDIRLVKTSKEDAIKIVNQFEGKWVYVKLIVKKNVNDSMHDYAISYNKFKIADVSLYSNLLFLYGNEDEDRLIISTGEIIQTEKSYVEDEVLIILKNEKITTDIYIKSFVPNKERLIHNLININQNLIITEGKTDWKHLKSAFKKFNAEGLYSNLKFKFLEYDESLSDDNDRLKDKKLSGANTLNTICQYNALFPNEKLRIFVFDSDKDDINKLYKSDQGYCYLGNNVYAVILPLPEFRKNTPAISIENYYTDSEIKTKDRDNKRLYLSSEFNFNEKKTDSKIYSLKARDNMPNLIIDDEVYVDNQNLEIPDKNELKSLIKAGKLKKVYTLSKNEFADNILNEIAPFNTISKDNFKLLFNIVKEIFEIHKQTNLNERLGLIERKEIQQGVGIESYHDHQELQLNIGLPDETIKALRSNATLASCGYVENSKIIIAINEIQLQINPSLDMLSFILKKAESANNKVYLNIVNQENIYACSYEIFKGDMGCMQFDRLIKQFQ